MMIEANDAFGPRFEIFIGDWIDARARTTVMRTVGCSLRQDNAREHMNDKVTHVTLSFDRELTDDEVKQLQLQHKAISAVRAAAGGGHHDHDHPKLV
jgi:hypothetical protein